MKIKNRQGLTLTELIISTILIGIVMLGVSIYTYSIKEMQSVSSKSAFLSLRLTNAMAVLKRDASLAVGSGQMYRGILTFQGTGREKSICFQHDNGDPFSYAEDQWRCYSLQDNRELWRCNVKATKPTDFASSTCSDWSTGEFLIYHTTDDFYSFEPSNWATGWESLEYVNFTLVSRFDPSTNFFPTSNPEASLEASVKPLGLN